MTLDFEATGVLLDDFTGGVELQPQSWRFTYIAQRDDRFLSCVLQLDRDWGPLASRSCAHGRAER